MKATLEFDDMHDLRIAIDAPRLRAAMWEFGEYLRSQEKYVEPADRDDTVAVRRMWFATLGSLLEDDA